jgi:IS605 OrfB family transposase
MRKTMRHLAIKVRLYPTSEQQQILAQHFGCSRWWNYALNLCIETYKETGKGLTQIALNKLLPSLKQQEETKWLSECYSQVFQTTTLNLVTAYKNFFQGRAKYPRFKSKKGRQSIQYPQSVKVVNNSLKFPGRVGTVKAKLHRHKARILVARVHERVSNVRQDFLHKLSRKLVDDNQVIVVESLHVKGMVRNHKLAKAISDVGWGMFVNFLGYKLDRVGKILVEIDRWFPSSKLCSNCHYQIGELPLEVRAWNCHNCGTHHDRDGNAAINIRAEGIRMLSVLGTKTAADGGDVSPTRGRKSKLTQSPAKSETASRLRVKQ